MGLSRRARAATGIAAPAAFVAAWVTGGLVKDGYSPVGDTISRLAEQGASTQPLMTAGFVAYGVLLPLFARELGRAVDSSGTRWAVTASGVLTLGVAACPLSPEGGTLLDSGHYLFAGTAYAANVVAPVLAARHLPGPAARRASYALGAAVAACLVLSTAVDETTGLWQRTGLTLFDAWAIAGAVWLIRRGSARSAL